MKYMPCESSSKGILFSSDSIYSVKKLHAYSLPQFGQVAVLSLFPNPFAKPIVLKFDPVHNTITFSPGSTIFHPNRQSIPWLSTCSDTGFSPEISPKTAVWGGNKMGWTMVVRDHFGVFFSSLNFLMESINEK